MSVETTCRSQSVRLKAQTAWLMLIMALAMCATAVGLCAAPLAAHAAPGDVPAHGKYLKDNNDGTYTIALNVKGDAEKDPQKVNVIVVFDTSSSMNTSTGNTEVTYTPTTSTGGGNYQNNLYGLIDGEYHALERTSTGPWYNPTYHFWYDGQEYTGQRYTRQQANQSRLQAAEHAVNELASALLAYNTIEGNDNDTVEMALVDFANMAEIAQQPTTSYSSFESVVNSRDAGNNNRGTNWEAGLRTTLNVDFDDDDPTYVIFVSDGNPTFYLQDPANTQRGGSGQENTDNINTSYNQAVPAAQAVVNAGNEFYTIGIYGNVSRMQNLTTASGADSSHYYAADDTAALQAALAEILAKIEMAGIGNVGINDGTTSNVGTATDPIDLLEVVPNFKYYRAGGDYCSLTDTTKYDPENGLYGVEWTGSDVPQAQFTDPTVTWNIPGILENGVVYTVTFDCYPSQTTLDTIADIKNDPSSYSSLPQAIKDYIDSDGNLKTNTTASLTYTDTRTGQTNNVGYTNPDPVETQTVEEMAVSKEWNNQLEDEWQKPASITLDVTRDEANQYKVVLNDGNHWTDNVFVSIGLIKNNEVLEGAEGHDFTFVEPAIESGYKWEIDVPIIHPMKIDGVVTMLILKGAAPYDNPDGAKEYTIGGKTYYVGQTGDASLTATNERRSSLNITKVVDGVDVPEDAVFPFTLNVKNSLAPATEPAGDTGHDSDYWVWISVWDKDQQAVTDAVVSGATYASGSWYYGKSGDDIVLNVKAGYSIRVNNVPVGTTYTITEGTLPNGFIFDSATAAKTDGDDGGKTWAFTGGQTSTGSVDTTNAVYTVTYTNKYELIDINVDKVWDDSDDQDGLRPDELELTLNGLPSGATAPTPVITQDGNTWTYVWKGVPRYDAQGKEIAYTVSENTVPEGYECTGSPANDGGTITNKHVPEVTNVTIVKEWDDSDDIGKIRPGTISAQLTADGAASGDPVELNASNQWTYTWSELPKYKDGVEIVYTADETAVPAGYVKDGPEKEVAQDGAITFTVTNTYNPTPVSVDPPVQKIITGNDGLYNKGDFTFTIEATSPANAPMPENTSITNSADYELPSNPGFYEFGEITFTMPGTYAYTVKESGTVPGVTNDPDAAAGKTLTFTVEDDGTGKLTVTPTTDQVQLSFTNKYDANGEAVLEVTKAISGAPWPSGKTLTLTLAGQGGTLPATTTATLDAAGTATFGAITYGLSDAGKTYTYTITEDGFGAGWTGSPESVTATVEVKDNGDGTLGTTVTYDPSDKTITNTYEAEGEAVLEVTKAISGAPWPSGKTLTLTLAGQGGTLPATTTATLDAAGTATFGAIKYTEADAGETYTYTITEDGFGDGWTGDPTSVTATVKVTDNGDGTLATAITYDPSDKTITNTYEAEGEASFPAKKVLTIPEGFDGPEDASWTFTLTGAENAPMPATTTYTVAAGESVTFGAIAYDQSDAGKTYTYTVTESGTVAGVTNDTESSKTVKVTVKDNGDGTLTATADPADGVTFTNVYNVEPVTAQIPVTKLVESEFDGSMTFDFELAAVDGAPMPGNATQSVTLTAADSKTVKFGEITYKKPGTYSYTIKETTPSGNGWTCDNEPKNVSVTVVDNKNGTMTATVTGADGEGDATTITNYYEPEGKEVSSEQEPEINIDGELVADGGILTYKIAYVNNTGKVATVKVEDNIPQYTEYVSGSAEPAAQFSGGKLTWTIENVAAGAEGFVTFKVKVNSGGAVVPIKNDAKVLVGQNESSTNSVTTTVPVKDVKNGETSIDNEGVQVGDTLTYVVSFNLAKDATSVIVTDDVPEHTTLVSGSIDNGGSLSGGTITWNLGALAAGDYTVSFKVTVDESAVTVDKIDNTAFISVNNHSDVKTNTVTNTPETGSLTISKKVVVPAGFSIDTAKAFNFKIALADKNGKDLAGEYKYSGDVSGTIANGGTITLRHNQSATIANLPAGAKYTVEETDVPAGYTAKAASVSGEIASESTVTAAFENTYSAEPTEVEKDFQAQKAVQFYDLAKLYDEQAGAGQFTFELVDKDGKVASTGTNDKDGNVSFSAITYTKPGKYVYTLREKNGGASYITYDTTEYKVTVNVVDNGDGTLTATVTPDGKSKPSFKNTYKATNKIQLSAVKFLESTIEGHTLQDGQFTFTLTGEDGAPMPAKATATNNAGGSVVFGEIVFDVSKIDEKAWVYENAEDAKQDEGKDESSEDSASAADESSDASADSAAADDSSGDTPADTSSDASADASADSAAADDSSGDAPADTSSSTSDDETTNNGDEGANSATDTTASQDGGNADADAGKKGADAADDDAAAPAEPANAASSDEGGAAAPAAADAGDASAASGASSPMMIARAMIAMPVKLISSVFGAELTSAAAVDASAAPVADAKALDAATVKDTVTSADKSAKSAKTAAADKSAKSAAKENATKAAAEAKAGSRTATFKYTITEVNDGQPGYTYDTHAENVTVTVTDDGEGNLKVTAEYDADGAEFVNPYKAKPASVVLAATKKLEGKTLADKQFTFKLTGSDGTSETVTNAANGSVTFSKIAYKKEGTYTYTITEVNDKQQYVTYDSSKHTATVTVTDNGQGALVAEVVYDTGTTAPTFKNTYKVPPKPTPDPPKKTPKQTAKTADPFSDALAGLLAFCAISGAGVAFARRKFKR